MLSDIIRIAFPCLADMIAAMNSPDLTQHITFIIVTYNSAHVIGQCLDALPPECHTIVVDNGSRDDTCVRLAQYPDVEVIAGHNIGYGRAANIGLAKATTPYAVLLNPDTILCEGAIETMLACAQKHVDVGIVGARMIDYQNGNKHYQKNYTFDDEGILYTTWIVGALMLFNMEILHKVGLFDEKIFLFFEETDLCDRMRKAGFRLAVCQTAEAEHVEGSSSLPSPRVTKIRSWHVGWSRVHYYRKHYGLAKAMRKSFTKIYKNLFRISGELFHPTGILLATTYETLGVLAYFAGIQAFRNDGTARIT